MSGDEQKVEIKLHGYLQKYSSTGPMGLYKSWQRLWFLHDDKSCQLLYYTAPTDDAPKGRIDISVASFTFLPERSKMGEFTIKSGGDEEHLLSAGNHDSMMQWINQLQTKRQHFSSYNSRDFTASTVFVSGICADSDSITATSPPAKPQGPSKVAMIKGLLKGLPSKSSRDQPSSTFFNTTPSETDTASITSAESVSAGAECTKCRDAQWAAFKLQTKINELQQSNTSYEEMLKELSLNFTEKVQAAEADNSAREILEMKEVIIGDLKRKLMTHCQEMDILKEELQDLRRDISEKDNQLRCTEEIIRCKEQVVINLSKPIPSPAPAPSSSYFYNTKQIVVYESEHEELKKQVAALSQQVSYFQGELTQLTALRSADEERRQQKLLDYEDLKAKHMKLSINHRVMMREFDKFVGGEMPIDSMELIGRIDIETRPYLCKEMAEERHAEEPFVPRQRLQEAQETIASYTAQNRLLEEEILQVNSLRYEERKQYHQVKAELDKINNHYMLLLREINKLRTGAEKTISGDLQEIAATLIEQVKDKDLLDVQQIGNDFTHRYDRYGFEITKLSAKVGTGSGSEMAWEKHIVQFGNDFATCKELKALVRAGVPHKYRSSFWRACIGRITADCPGRDETNFYRSLLAQADPSDHNNIFTKQIELDLMRTLPNNCLFNSTTATGVDKLRNVLLAFARYNLEIGYCQGLNRIAAFALAVLSLKEEEAFWAVVAVVELLPPDYYSQTMAGAQVDQRVLADIMADKYPRIMAHFNQFKIDLSLITFNWFLTLFVDNTNIDVVLSFWDLFFYEGDKVLFRYALAIFRIHHDKLLLLRDGIDVYNFCRGIGDGDLCTPENIKKIAFGELNPFPFEKLVKRREHHLRKVHGEMNALNEARTQYNAHKRSSVLDCDSD